MRLAAATLIPLVVLAGLELGLRVAGYGYPTRFLLPSTIDGQDYLIPNHRFSYRFFPPALAREPALFRMQENKPEGTFRIFLFGESAALGDPDPAYGVSRHLEVLLQARYPSTQFEVICVAMTAINSHVILPIAHECARYEADLWVIYMGNNEMVGPYGAGTVFGPKAPGRTVVRWVLALKTTRGGQLLDRLLQGLRRTGSASESWRGIDMFTRNPLRPDDAARIRSYADFEANLEEILQAAISADIPVLLSTVAANLRDCSPFVSLHAADSVADRLEEWERAYREGIKLEGQGAHAAALHAYSNALAIDPQFAELQFRIGTCQLALNNYTPAMQAFERARDQDALAVRAETRINQIIRDAARRHRNANVSLLDAVSVLARDSGGGVPGRNLFYDHVHYTLEGNHRLARSLTEEIVALSLAGIADNGTGEWLGVEDCNRRLAATCYDEGRIWTKVDQRIRVPPFSSQTTHEASVRHCQDQLEEILAQITEDTSRQDRATYEAALARSPDDVLLNQNYAQFLEMTGLRTESILQAQRVCRLLPDHPWPHYYAGTLLMKAGRMDEASEHFERALERRDDFTQARIALQRTQQRPAGTANSAP